MIQMRVIGDLRQMMGEVRQEAEQAVTAAINQAGIETLGAVRVDTSAALGQRVANAWRMRSFPGPGRASLGAAALVWSKAAVIVDAFDRGATIRPQEGGYLAIPLPAAGSRGVGGARITPAGFAARTGLRLRFVFRQGKFPLLVVDNARLTSAGRAAGNTINRGGAIRTRLRGRTTIPVFVLVPQVKLPKRLNLQAQAERSATRLVGLMDRELEKALR